MVRNRLLTGDCATKTQMPEKKGGGGKGKGKRNLVSVKLVKKHSTKLNFKKFQLNLMLLGGRQ